MVILFLVHTANHSVINHQFSCEWMTINVFLCASGKTIMQHLTENMTSAFLSVLLLLHSAEAVISEAVK